MFADVCRKYLLISALFGFPFLYRKGLRLFQQSFAIVRKCRYPGQLKFKNQRQVEIIFIARFVISVIVAFTFICFIILMVPNPNKTKFTRLLTFEVVCCLHLLLILQLLPRIVKSIPGRRYKALIIFSIICLYCVRVVLTLDVNCVITFLIFCCDIVHKEVFCITSTVAIGNGHEG